MGIPDGGAEELAWGLLRVPGAWPSKGMWTHVHEYRAILWNGRVFWEVVREVEFRPDGALESRYDGTDPGGPVDDTPHDPPTEFASGTMTRLDRDAFERYWSARHLREAEPGAEG